MHHHPDMMFPALALVVATLGGWTALDLFARVRHHVGVTRRFWIGAAAVALGLSIWAMHFIAMLGFDPGSPVSYDPMLTLVSLGLAIGGTGVGFAAASSGQAFTATRAGAGGLVMGASICAMHYVGMAAMVSAVSLGYRPLLVALSLVIAVGASTAALMVTRHSLSRPWRLTAALTLGLAIAGMHYTAMAALILTPTGETTSMIGAPPVMLAITTAFATGLLLILGLGASVWDDQHLLRMVIEAGGIGYWRVELPSRRILMSPGGRRLFGLATEGAITADDLANTLTGESRQVREETFAAAARGERDYQAEYQIAGEPRWIEIRGKPIRDRAGRVTGMAGVVLDATERRQAFAALEVSQRRQQLLINELNHRVKNTLATIQSIALLTARRADSVEAFTASFQSRLMALSSTHNLLTAQGWEQADVGGLFREELSPYSEEQVRFSGPEMWLSAEQALAMGMIAHELATNAAKYGALSTPDGCVRVTWAWLDKDRGLAEMRWSEIDGPPIQAPPTRQGFGSQLIKTSVEHGLGGRAEVDFASDGMKLVLTFTVRRTDPGGATLMDATSA